MTKILKRPLSVLLAALMIVSLFAIVPITASAATTGSFGSLTWNIDDDGTLTFSGSGAIPMEAFEKNGDVKKVIINDSVTELGAYAFLGCPNLTEVDIQNPSVSLKGAQHFATAGVTTVTLPEGMTTIPYGMFRRCGALTTVDLPSTITRIEDLAFEGSGLQSISVPEGATYESNSFQTDSLQSLTLEGSSPMTFTGGEFTFLSDAATVFIPEGSTYVYSTTTLYVKDPSNWDAQEMLEYAQEDFNERIEFGSSPEEALAEVNDLYGDYYGITEPFTVTLNEGDKCEAVFGGATIGKYAPAPTTYTVTWKNGDGTVIDTTEVEEGTVPTHADATKANDTFYSYTFAGWNDGENTYAPSELPAVTGDVTYTATYTATAKTKPWTDEITTGGEYTCPSTLSHNTIVSGGTEENPVIINITGQTTVQAPIFLRSGYLKIVGNNNSVVANRGFVSFSVNVSSSCIPNGDAHLTITDLSFSSTNASNQYIQINSQNYKCQSSLENVTFKNCNINGSGAVVISSETTHTLKNCTFEDNTGYNAGGISFRYGSDVTMEGCTFKNCTRTRPYSTSFLGGGAVWVDKNTKLTLDGCTFENCTGECGAVGIASTATLTLKGNTTITGNANGNLYLPTGATFNVAEDFTGTVGVTTQTAPTDSASVTLASGLADTQAALANNNIVSDNENYGVRYDSNKLFLVVPATYTVTWKNGDTVIETDTDVAEGTTPTYDGATPTKANDDYHSYNFSGWTDGTNTYGASDTLPAVTGDVTYTAKYTVFTKQFTVFVKTTTGKTITANGVSGDTTVAELKDMVVEESGIPAAEQRLIFAGKEMENEKTLADYRIQKESTLHVVGKSYTITWKNDDGTVIDTTSVAYGTVPTHDAYKADGANCIYTFSGWTPEVSAVTGDATYTAQFTESEKPETIKDCNNKYGNFRLYSNVPLVQYSDFEDILDGAIIPITYGDSNTMIPVQDAKGYSYKFYDQTGTEIPAQITDSSSAPGSNYELSDDVTVYTNVINFTRPAGCTAIYIVATAPTPEGINYGGDNYIDPKGTQEVSSSDEGKIKFGLDLGSYLNMQMLGIQLKNSIATEGGDDGVRFVTAVNSNLLKGDNIEDYGYIVAKIDSNIESLYNNMNKFTAEKFIAQGAADTNIFTCKGSSNSISGEFGKYSSNTDYKYVTLAVTGTSGKSGNLVARFYVKTKDGQYHYADYINGSKQTYSGMAFSLSAVSANLG